MSYFRIKWKKVIKSYIFVGPGRIQIRPSLGSLLQFVEVNQHVDCHLMQQLMRHVIY
jgi:hypothetical protein